MGPVTCPAMNHHNVDFTTALVSALVSLGLRDVCISPGSRNVPLIAALAANPAIRSWVHLDERSAGFFALGLARATGKPVALASTSGTAAVEYHPALVEASLSGVPLLALTADRPPELRGVGAPQTIDQVGLYGVAVKLSIDLPPPSASSDTTIATSAAEQAWAAATSGYPGPVHLNLPFREPLLDTESGIRPAEPTAAEAGNEPPVDLAALAARLEGKRGLIVAGRAEEPAFAEAAVELAGMLEFPVIADPLSGMRHGLHPTDLVLSAGDALVAAGALDEFHPEVVLRFGPVPTSKATWRWLGDHRDVDQILVDIPARDATRSAATTITSSPAVVAAALAKSIHAPAPAKWTADWADIDRIASGTIDTAVAAAPFPNEPAIAGAVLAGIPEGTVLTVGSSMPIRDIDTFGGKSARQIKIVGNRGASGIDGLISAALGSAASGAPAVALVGDVSAFHDLNAIATAATLALPLTIVVVNNNGGGIFHFLPHREPGWLDDDAFERFLATPHETDFAAVATALGVSGETITARDGLQHALDTTGTGPRLLQLHTDREVNLALHRSIATRVKAAIGLR